MEKAEPRRTCVGCRQAHPTSELVRVALVDGMLEVSRTALGRGAWLCAGSPRCLVRAVRRRAFDAAFHRSVPVSALRRLVEELGHKKSG